MQKKCSLDFLNKQNFEVDIFSEEEEKIFSAEDKVTPELILKLYFRKIKVETNI